MVKIMVSYDLPQEKLQNSPNKNQWKLQIINQKAQYIVSQTIIKMMVVSHSKQYLLTN